MGRFNNLIGEQAMFGLWHFLHVLSVVVWVGGMFFVLHCLRPAVADLQPLQRAPLMANALGRFFNAVLLAIVLIWVSGLMMAAPLGWKAAPIGWHLMLAFGAVMTLIFGYIRFALYPQLATLVSSGDMPGAARVLGQTRLLVVINFVLGVLAMASVSMLA